MRGKRWRRYESLSISERYTVRPYQASVTVTVPPAVLRPRQRPIFEKRLSFRISGYSGEGRSLQVSSYDPTIVHGSKMPNYDLTIVHPSNMDRVGHCLRWLHQFTLLPRSPDGANLLLSVS